MALTIITPPAADPVSESEVWAHLRLTLTGSPAEPEDKTLVQAITKAAVAHLDGRDGILSRALMTQTWDYSIDRFPDGDTITLPLAQAFKRFSHVITWNSNTAVEAVIAGVPAVAVDRGSMAWDVSGRDVNAAPPRPDRRAWADRLTWCQWTAQELADGTAWEAVRNGYHMEATA